MIQGKRLRINNSEHFPKGVWAAKLKQNEATQRKNKLPQDGGMLQLARARVMNLTTVFFFSTFDMDKLGKIRRHHWKDRL